MILFLSDVSLTFLDKMQKESTNLALQALRLTTIYQFILNCPIRIVKDTEIIKNIVDAEVAYLLKDYRTAFQSHQRAQKLLVTIKRHELLTNHLLFKIFDCLALGWIEDLKPIVHSAEKIVKLLPRPNFFFMAAYCKMGNHQKVISIYKKMKKANYFKCKARFIQANILILLAYKELGDQNACSKAEERVSTSLLSLKEEDLKQYHGLFELFQQVYFMARQSFQANMLQRGRKFIVLIWTVLKRVWRESELAYEFLLNQLKAGDHYDIMLLKFAI